MQCDRVAKTLQSSCPHGDPPHPETVSQEVFCHSKEQNNQNNLLEVSGHLKGHVWDKCTERIMATVNAVIGSEASHTGTHIKILGHGQWTLLKVKSDCPLRGPERP